MTDTSQICEGCHVPMRRTRPNRYKCPRCGAWRILCAFTGCTHSGIYSRLGGVYCAAHKDVAQKAKVS